MFMIKVKHLCYGSVLSDSFLSNCPNKGRPLLEKKEMNAI